MGVLRLSERSRVRCKRKTEKGGVNEPNLFPLRGLQTTGSARLAPEAQESPASAGQVSVSGTASMRDFFQELRSLYAKPLEQGRRV